MMRTRLVVVGMFVALAGCASQSAQPVTTEAQAIGVAKDLCAANRPFDMRESWHAKLRDGQWHVWLVRDRDPREPAVGTLDLWIRASDGNAGNCNKVQ
jgi:hypothetical protein